MESGDAAFLLATNYTNVTNREAIAEGKYLYSIVSIRVISVIRG